MTVQLRQSKLCCLTVGVLALPPTRTVCLAIKEKKHILMSRLFFHLENKFKNFCRRVKFPNN